MDPSIRHSLTFPSLLSAAETINKLHPFEKESQLTCQSSRDAIQTSVSPPKKTFLASRPPDGRRRKKGGMPICGGRNASLYSRPPLFYARKRGVDTHAGLFHRLFSTRK